MSVETNYTHYTHFTSSSDEEGHASSDGLIVFDEGRTSSDDRLSYDEWCAFNNNRSDGWDLKECDSPANKQVDMVDEKYITASSGEGAQIDNHPNDGRVDDGHVNHDYPNDGHVNHDYPNDVHGNHDDCPNASDEASPAQGTNLANSTEFDKLAQSGLISDEAYMHAMVACQNGKKFNLQAILDASAQQHLEIQDLMNAEITNAIAEGRNAFVDSTVTRTTNNVRYQTNERGQRVQVSTRVKNTTQKSTRVTVLEGKGPLPENRSDMTFTRNVRQLSGHTTRSLMQQIHADGKTMSGCRAVDERTSGHRAVTLKSFTADEDGNVTTENSSESAPLPKNARHRGSKPKSAPGRGAKSARFNRRCKHGADCRNTKCSYNHPAERPKVNSSKWFRTILCKYDLKCTRAGCRYGHSDDQPQRRDANNTSPSTRRGGRNDGDRRRDDRSQRHNANNTRRGRRNNGGRRRDRSQHRNVDDDRRLDDQSQYHDDNNDFPSTRRGRRNDGGRRSDRSQRRDVDDDRRLDDQSQYHDDNNDFPSTRRGRRNDGYRRSDRSQRRDVDVRHPLTAESNPSFYDVHERVRSGTEDKVIFGQNGVVIGNRAFTEKDFGARAQGQNNACFYMAVCEGNENSAIALKQELAGPATQYSRTLETGDNFGAKGSEAGMEVVLWLCHDQEPPRGDRTGCSGPRRVYSPRGQPRAHRRHRLSAPAQWTLYPSLSIRLTTQLRSFFSPRARTSRLSEAQIMNRIALAVLFIALMVVLALCVVLAKRLASERAPRPPSTVVTGGNCEAGDRSRRPRRPQRTSATRSTQSAKKSQSGPTPRAPARRTMPWSPPGGGRRRAKSEKIAKPPKRARPGPSTRPGTSSSATRKPTRRIGRMSPACSTRSTSTGAECGRPWLTRSMTTGSGRGASIWSAAAPEVVELVSSPHAVGEGPLPRGAGANGPARGS